MIMYETVERDGSEFPLRVAHFTLAEAEAYAEGRNVESILQIGGYWDEYVRCPICHDWVLSSEISEDGLCAACERAGRDHGF